MADRIAGTGDRWVAAVLVAAAAAFHLAGLARVAAPNLYWFDESIYTYSAVIANTGQTPYRDFCYVHPPGLLWLDQGVLALGGGVYGLRLVWWSLGAVVLAQTYQLAARAYGGGEGPSQTAGGLAALLVASSSVFQELAVQNVAHLAMPALGFVLLKLLARPTGTRPWAAGLVVVAMSLFRLQAVYFVPAAVAYVWLEHGLRAGWRPSAKFAAAGAVGAAALHGGLACAYPGYVENVVRFQMLRPSTDVWGRFAVLHTQMQDWPFVVGLLAAAALGGGPGGRGVAGYAVAGVAALAAGSRYFAGLYLIAFTPALAALAGRWVARSARGSGGVLAAAGVVALFQAVELFPK